MRPEPPQNGWEQQTESNEEAMKRKTVEETEGKERRGAPTEDLGNLP